jgi:hypothetical protein
MLSGGDILNLVPGVKVIQYKSLSRVRRIQDIIPPQGLVILTPTVNSSQGHWVCLYYHNGILHFFDSYGNKPDEALTYDKGNLGANERGRLNQLLLESNLPVDFNNYQLQSADPSISTCGYWCVIRLWMKDLSTEEFFQIWKLREGQEHLPDELVEYFVKYS